jgi:hypothetical protein
MKRLHVVDALASPDEPDRNRMLPRDGGDYSAFAVPSSFVRTSPVRPSAASNA